MSELRRVLVVPEVRTLAIDCEAIATIVDFEVDETVAWLPALVFGATEPAARRRTLILADGGHVEVPATMHLVESVEILAIPELLAAAAEAIGVIGLAVLPAGLTLCCDPRRIVGARS